MSVDMPKITYIEYSGPEHSGSSFPLIPVLLGGQFEKNGRAAGLSRMLEYFSDDGHWTRGRYDAEPRAPGEHAGLGAVTSGLLSRIGLAWWRHSRHQTISRTRLRRCCRASSVGRTRLSSPAERKPELSHFLADLTDRAAQKLCRLLRGVAGFYALP